jgi:hypothetical protein
MLHSGRLVFVALLCNYVSPTELISEPVAVAVSLGVRRGDHIRVLPNAH